MSGIGGVSLVGNFVMGVSASIFRPTPIKCLAFENFQIHILDFTES